jgi:hypothetical protein
MKILTAALVATACILSAENIFRFHPGAGFIAGFTAGLAK